MQNNYLNVYLVQISNYNNVILPPITNPDWNNNSKNSSFLSHSNNKRKRLVNEEDQSTVATSNKKLKIEYILNDNLPGIKDLNIPTECKSIFPSPLMTLLKIQPNINEVRKPKLHELFQLYSIESKKNSRQLLEPILVLSNDTKFCLSIKINNNIDRDQIENFFENKQVNLITTKGNKIICHLQHTISITADDKNGRSLNIEVTTMSKQKTLENKIFNLLSYKKTLFNISVGEELIKEQILLCTRHAQPDLFNLLKNGNTQRARTSYPQLYKKINSAQWLLEHLKNINSKT